MTKKKKKGITLKIDGLDTWEIEHMDDTDELFIGKPVIPQGCVNFMLNVPMCVQVDRKGRIHGIFMEYFKYEFERIFPNGMSKQYFDHCINVNHKHKDD